MTEEHSNKEIFEKYWKLRQSDRYFNKLDGLLSATVELSANVWPESKGRVKCKRFLESIKGLSEFDIIQETYAENTIVVMYNALPTNARKPVRITESLEVQGGKIKTLRFIADGKVHNEAQSGMVDQPFDGLATIFTRVVIALLVISSLCALFVTGNYTPYVRWSGDYSERQTQEFLNLVAIVPLLVFATIKKAEKSLVWYFAWVSALGFASIVNMILVFTGVFNTLYLLYAIAAGLSLIAALFLIGGIPLDTIDDFLAECGEKLPLTPVALYLIIVPVILLPIQMHLAGYNTRVRYQGFPDMYMVYDLLWFIPLAFVSGIWIRGGKETSRGVLFGLPLLLQSTALSISLVLGQFLHLIRGHKGDFTKLGLHLLLSLSGGAISFLFMKVMIQELHPATTPEEGEGGAVAQEEEKKGARKKRAKGKAKSKGATEKKAASKAKTKSTAKAKKKTAGKRDEKKGVKETKEE